MKTLLATRYVTIPEGVTLEVKSRVVTVTGPRGELVQSFKHVNLDLQKSGTDKLRVDLWFGNRKQVCGLLGYSMIAVIGLVLSLLCWVAAACLFRMFAICSSQSVVACFFLAFLGCSAMAASRYVGGVNRWCARVHSRFRTSTTLTDIRTLLEDCCCILHLSQTTLQYCQAIVSSHGS